jgi:hypothetical protein
MPAVLAFVAAEAAAAVACSGPLPLPRDPVSLDSARVLSMSVALAEGTAICPGQDVPLAIDVAVLRRGESTPTVVHARRTHVHDAIFEPATLAIRSAQGAIDRDGIFHASADPRLSAEGFTLQLHPSRGDDVTVRFPATYGCVRSAGVELASAPEGTRGMRGDNIGHPIKAAPGGPGGTGDRGADAPNVVVYVTLVKTPEHEKLIAVLVDDGSERLTLAPADAPLRIAAQGGAGGHGGRGGEGGVGSTWCADERRRRNRRRGTFFTVCVERRWSVPGDGGRGGDGGDGGAGGRLEVHVDRRHPELADALALDVSGGAAGLAGASGAEGETNPHAEWQDLPARFRKARGMPGTPGANGRRGRDGTAVVVLDDVSAQFERMGAIEPL